MVALKESCQIRTKAMYKDEDKQREANRERQRRYKAKHKGVTSEGVTGKALLGDCPSMADIKSSLCPDGIIFDDNNDVHVEDQAFTKLMAQARPGHVRVSKPGDADYVPQCKTTRRRFIDGRLSIGENTTFGDLKRQSV